MTTATAAASPVPESVRYIRSHDFRAPLPDDVKASLRSAAGHRAPQVWAELCGELGIPPHTELLAHAEIERMAAALAARPGVLGLAGRSLLIRARAFSELSKQAATGSAPPWDWARKSMGTLLQARLPSPERTAELASLDLFGPVVRARLDRLAWKAAHTVRVPIGLIGIVLEGAQPFIGTHGLSGWSATAGGVPIEWSFCATMVRTGVPYVLPDTAVDVIQRTNPLAVHDGARSYAGVPLLSGSGHVLGSVCGVGDEPREFTAEDLAALTALAAEVVSELELARTRDDDADQGRLRARLPGTPGATSGPRGPG